MLFFIKTLEDEQYVVIKVYKFTNFEILIIIILHVHTIPTHRVYQLYDTSLGLGDILTKECPWVVHHTKVLF